MIRQELHFDKQDLRYTGIIGTGGIGSGKFFRLNGDHTLGREESRSGHFLDIRDYCKQHIILHYIKVLLGPAISVIPVGKVGDDELGNNLISEMKATGMEMDYLEKVPDASTLFSFCFSYPDHTGGNLTTDNSASALVDPGYIEKVKKELQKLGPRGIIMAAPEVPLNARYALLRLGRENRLFCTASFTSEEICLALDSGILNSIDLVAFNLDEASTLAGNSTAGKDTIFTVNNAIRRLQGAHRNMLVSITAGMQGSFCWDGHTLNAWPAIITKATSTAGAGDAFFSGLICGIALGFHLFEAQQLATLLAGLSVTSPHTIHKGIDRSSLHSFMRSSDLEFSEKITKILED